MTPPASRIPPGNIAGIRCARASSAIRRRWAKATGNSRTITTSARSAFIAEGACEIRVGTLGGRPFHFRDLSLETERVGRGHIGSVNRGHAVRVGSRNGGVAEDRDTL